NWLGFSLSNHNHHHPHINNLHSTSSDDSSHLCLFEAFHTTTTPPGNVVNTSQDDAATGATDLSIFTAGPKLEDFLGGSTTAPPPPQHDLTQFSSENNVSVTLSEAVIYDSELKTIAASFLRGFNNEQTDNHHNQQPLIQADPIPKKTLDTFGHRTSIYRGVTRHRWTGRFEAHLWDNSCRREGQSRKGRQVYLGGYDKEEKAARAYDLAALKYWGPATTTNFPVSNYEKELEEMKNMTRQEFVASLRRRSSGFSRGASIYRGVTRHHQHGRWQARIGRVAGNKDLYLGTFSTQEEAAEAYDIAAIKFRGLNAVTNFDMSRYDVKSIANSNLPVGGVTKSKNSSESASDCKSIDGSRSDDRDFSPASSVTFASSQPATSTLSFAIPIKQDPSADYWSLLGYHCNSATITTLNNNKNPSVAPGLFQNSTNGSGFQSLTAFNMDFAASSSVNESNNNIGLFNNCGYNGYHQQQNVGISTSSSSSSIIPFATPIALNSGSNCYEGGSWIAQSLHSYQSAKPNLSLFQTPIFGME
ncbi:AP2 domain-containing protein, partial [Cephalotus follicularis]